MKVTLSLEKTTSSDVSIMVDALRASSTITVALDKFEKVIPCFSPEEAFKLKDKYGGAIAGERMGEQIEGFDVGNSPKQLENFESDEDTLILTTSNGTRILEEMTSTVLVGSLINAKAVGKASSKIAKFHINVVMAGVRGMFALEDFLASGEILYWICRNVGDCELNDLAKAAVMASRDYKSVKEAFHNCRTGRHLTELGYIEDIEICSLKNISDNVAIYENRELKLIKD